MAFGGRASDNRLDEASQRALMFGQGICTRREHDQRVDISHGFEMIQPRDVPRLPVLDWQGFGLGGVRAVPSIIDGSVHFFTSSGRAAIMLGLESLGIHEGDRVLVPTYHCPTMVAPIIAVGAEPVFYPINGNGEALLENVMLIQSARVKAAIVPHFFGIPQDLSAIRAFCDRHSIALIEDCAHCFFGTSRQTGGRSLG